MWNQYCSIPCDYIKEDDVYPVTSYIFHSTLVPGFGSLRVLGTHIHQYPWCSYDASIMIRFRYEDSKYNKIIVENPSIFPECAKCIHHRKY